MTSRLPGILRVLFAAAIIAVVCISASGPVRAAIADDIAAKTRQIEDIQRQIDDYQHQIDENHSKASTLQSEIARLNAKIGQVTLEIKSLGVSIDQTSLQITDTRNRIFDAEEKISKHKDALGQYLRLSYETEKKTLTEILLDNATLSEFFNDVNSVHATQDNLRVTIDDIRQLKDDLGQRKDELEDRQTDLQRMKNLQEFERRSLDGNKQEKNTLLKVTKGQESKFQDLVKKSQADIERLRAQITYLAQNGISAEEAVKFGQLAAIATGIRPAFLIAELEVESGIGINVGRCNRESDPPEKSWRNIMSPKQFDAWLQVMSQLGMNPDTTAVSCPQYVNGHRYGWGGAMGPAQFIPTTWLAYAAATANLVHRATVNPWNIEDAFTAAAVKLARGGATSQIRAGEVAASKAYYSGNPSCSSGPCNSYANAVQRKAAEIEQNL